MLVEAFSRLVFDYQEVIATPQNQVDDADAWRQCATHRHDKGLFDSHDLPISNDVFDEQGDCVEQMVLKFSVC